MYKSVEECDECEKETKHQIEIQIRQVKDSYHSREPYRVAECEECGSEEVKRMN